MDDNGPVEFAEPYLQMTCIDPAPGADPAVLAEFTKYYTQVHTPDVVRNNPGIRRAYRYELAVPDPSGAFGPKWLSIYEWENRHGAQVFVVRGEAPGGSWRPDYLPEPPIWSAIGRGPRQWGRLMCNRLAESGPPGSPPAAILMEGFDPPAGLGDAEFQAFQMNVVATHGLKINDQQAYSRVTKYALEELGTKPVPANDKPHFLAIYEADAATAAAFDGKLLPPAEPANPDLRRRRIAWRHVYRRISGCIYPGARYTTEML
jgi:hypothetical protein